MPKPINLAYQDFKEKLVELVNGSGLPMCFVADCMTIVLDKVQDAAETQLLNARKEEAEKANED